MRLSLLIIALIGTVELFAQQEWVYSMQALNLYDGNAAAAGMYERTSINLRYRSQFTSWEGAPQSMMLSVNGGGQRLGLGLRVMNEEIGVFRRTAAVGHASYKLPTSKGELRFGLGGGVLIQATNDITLGSADVAEDPSIAGLGNTTSPIIQAAIMFRNRRFFVGVEGNHLLPDDELNAPGTAREILAMAGSQHKLNQHWSLRPMLAARWSEPEALLPEAQLGVWYDQTLWLGAGHRLGADTYGFVEYRFRGKVRFGYSFGVSTAGGAGLGPNHELMIGYLTGGKRTRSMQSIRYFQ